MDYVMLIIIILLLIDRIISKMAIKTLELYIKDNNLHPTKKDLRIYINRLLHK